MLEDKNKVIILDKAIFIFLCIFMLCFALSIAGANVGMGGACALFIARVCIRRDDIVERFYKVNKGIWLTLGAFTLTAFISSVFAIDAGHALSTFANYYLYRMLPLFIIFFIIQDKKKLLILVGLLLGSFTLNNIWEMYQVITAFVNGDNIVGWRFSGNLYYMNQGGLLAAAIPAIFVMLFKKDIPKYFYLIFVLAVAALLFNGTRGAMVSVIVTLPVMLVLLIRNKVKLLAMILAIMVSAGAIYSMLPSVQYRVDTITSQKYQANTERLLIWNSALEMYKDYPLSGIGLGNFKHEYQTKYISPEAKEPYLGHAHSNLMHILAEQGTLGFISFLSLWLYLLYRFFKDWKERHDIVSVMILGMWFSAMLQGLTEYSIGAAVTAKFYFVAIGMYLSWMQLDDFKR